MSFTEAVRSVLTQYATFSGRARRSEYWWFTLFYAVVALAVDTVGLALHVPFLVAVVFLALLLPTIAVAVRRLHDTGRSGWWYLLGFVPFGGIVVFVFMLIDSQTDTNKYGPCPKSAGYSR